MAESIIDLASDDVDLGHLLSESERLESRAEGRAETYQALLDAGILKYKDLEKFSKKTNIALPKLRIPDRSR